MAFLVLNRQGSQFLEQTLGLLVVAMALVFVGTALILQPSIGDILRGLFIPTLPKNAGLIVLGKFGTTVVPYNLYLHASVIKRHSKEGMTLAEARRDIQLSVVGGRHHALHCGDSGNGTSRRTESTSSSLISANARTATQASEFCRSGLGFLPQAYPQQSRHTCHQRMQLPKCSAMTQRHARSIVFKWTWRIVLAFGVAVASLSLKPIELIVFAQFTNGLLPPITAAFILWIANDSKYLGNIAALANNAIGFFVLAVTGSLGLRGILLASGWL